MALVHFSPFSELETVQAQMNRLLDEVTSWQGEDKALWRPSVELLDSDKNLTLKASLPGIPKDNIEIQLTREKVRISGEYNYEKREEEVGVYHSEFRYGKFDRAIALPVGWIRISAESNILMPRMSKSWAGPAPTTSVKLDMPIPINSPRARFSACSFRRSS